MTTPQHFRTVGRLWWVVVICLVAGVVFTMILSSRSPRHYSSSTSVLVIGTASTQASTATAYQASLLAQQRMPNYADVATSTTLATSVLKGLHTSLTPAELADRTTTHVSTNSSVLEISITDTDADRAQLLASRAGKAMALIIDRMEQAQASPTQLLQGMVLTAGVPASDSGTNVWRNPLFGSGLGILVGFAILGAVSRVDPRVLDGDAVDQVDLPVLARIPISAGRWRRGDPRARTRARSAYLNALREARTALFFQRRGSHDCLTVAITSPRALVGSSSIARGVAESLAETGARVLLVAAARSGDAVSEDTQHENGQDIDVVSPTSAPELFSDPLGSPTFVALLAEAAERYDFVLVNAPATSEGPAAAAVAGQSDIAVLVVQRSTRVRQLHEALRQLANVNADVCGVVVLS